VASVNKRSTTRGDRYDVRFRAPDGGERSRTFRTRRDADRFAATVAADMLRGAWVDPRSGRIPLEEYGQTWLATRAGLRPRTRETYEAQLRLHVYPELGATDIGQLTPRAVREWFGRLVGSERVSGTTAAKCYRLLRTILGTAVEDELILTNPCKVAGAGIERSTERPTATVDQVLNAAAAMPDRLSCYVLLAGFGGLRVGELLGLERRHVNSLHGLITVEQQEHQLRDGTLVVGPPKSDAGVRTISLPAFLVDELDAHLAAHVGAHPEARVFRGERGGPLRRHVAQKHWSVARAKAGLGSSFRFHDLRHTANTLAAASGASTRELMYRMGHASSQAAILYQHATRERDARLARALGELIEASRDASRDGRGMEGLDDAGDEASEPTEAPVTRTFAGAGDENRTRVLSLGS
jgi:integrase